MFQKKEYIFSDAIGACVVEDVVKLSAQKNATPVLYYVLRSVTDRKKTSYIPVENHRSLLRPLISLEEAQDVLATAWAKEKRAEAGGDANEAGRSDSLEQKRVDDAADVQQEKLLQEAIFVVERHRKRLEELKGKEE